jgi:RNA polymerase sigma factor (sigma-70 family)
VETSRVVGGTDGDLFADIYPGLVRFAAAVRPVGIEPEDLVQEALARTLQVHRLHDLDEPATYLRTAMIRIASNLQRGRRRAVTRIARLEHRNETVDSYPSELADLLRLEPRARAVLFLTVIEGEQYRTAAAIVGCSESAARTIASRALHDLRAHVSAELDAREAT